MKYVKLNWDKGWESKTILNAVVQQAQDGIRYAEIKKRCRILDALEELEEGAWYLVLEDADYELLKGCCNSFKFGAATKGILKILDFVMEAESAPASNSLSTECVPERRVPIQSVDGGDPCEPYVDTRSPDFNGVVKSEPPSKRVD